MEYIENGNLGGYMKSSDPQKTRAEAPEITRQDIGRLEILHKEGICHQDLKPYIWLFDIMLTRDITSSLRPATQFKLKSPTLGPRQELVDGKSERSNNCN